MAENVEKIEFRLGQTFSSFEEMNEFKRSFEDSNYCQLWIADSRSIENAKKRGVTRPINPGLKYYRLHLRCLFSGTCKSKSKGYRPNQTTYRQGCPFDIKIKASLDGNNLEVSEVINEHNHQCSEDIYSDLPRQRKLEGPVREFARYAMKMGADKRQLLAELQTISKITLKDLHNLAQEKKEENLKTALTCLVPSVKDSSRVKALKNAGFTAPENSSNLSHDLPSQRNEVVVDGVFDHSQSSLGVSPNETAASTQASSFSSPIRAPQESSQPKKTNISEKAEELINFKRQYVEKKLIFKTQKTQAELASIELKNKLVKEEHEMKMQVLKAQLAYYESNTRKKDWGNNCVTV